MKRRRSLLGDVESQENFWPAFTDLTSTIALILFVLVLLAYLQNLLSGKKLQHIRAELDETAEQLGNSQAEISRSEKKLKLLETEMAKTMAEIEAGKTRLKLSEDKIVEQQNIIAESNRELGDLRAKLQGIAVLRFDVLRKVKAAIESELQSEKNEDKPLVRIADNGNIIINERLVFEYNSFKIKPAGKPLLRTLSKAFSNLLKDAHVLENIDVILVQGHTDKQGSVAFNRDLSAKRANAVLNYMFDAEPSLETSFGPYFASSAYSEFRPISLGDTEADYEQNRRIEISVVLKDSNIQNVIDTYMKNQTELVKKSDEPTGMIL